MKVMQTCFLNETQLNDDEKRMCELEDQNMIVTMFGWEPTQLQREDHCCEDMFHYLQKDDAWMQFVSYDKTYALPYNKLLSKKQLRKIWRHVREMQWLKFCPFCGTSLIDEKVLKSRIKMMEDYYEQHKKEDEAWVFFWNRHRHTAQGGIFFSDKWRR
jgi:hypothetical protein